MPKAPAPPRIPTPSQPVQQVIAAAALLAFFTWFRVRLDQHVVARAGEFVDADFWPGLLLSVGMLLSAGLLLMTIVKWRKAVADEPPQGPAHDQEPEQAEGDAPIPSAVGSGWKALGGLALVIGYAYLLRPVGFLVTTVLFCVLFLALQRVRNWIFYVAIPVGVNALVLIVFTRMLQSPLPQGQGFFRQISAIFY